MKRHFIHVVYIAIFITILSVLLIPLCENYFEHNARMKKLSAVYAYDVYFTYVENRMSYHLYVLCNPKYSITDILKNVITPDYLIALKEKISTPNTPPATTNIYLMESTTEIPFGWEKSDLNISCNFNLAIFHQNTICTVIVPYGTATIEDCTINIH